MQSVSDLTAHTGYWLRMVSNAVSQDFARKLAAEGVTVAEWVFLRALYDVDSMAPSALAGRMGMTRGAISKLADRLIEKGLIDRVDNPDDRRAHSLSLTKAGRARVPVLAALADRNDADYFGVLSADEQDALGRILRHLAERRGLKAMPLD
ncbi:DNA-binding transcriptional regulator, MarR family [Pseudoxanthobacter soli DSM 19599]|uniref:DNA-binding transcriptional regulator, MarR family n=1 Tax=Pseudoxanthobacter soli DSM 19599 TaxID=1123029 RepID=A0A1M7ZQB3_9HYPH|nr:MarR family transcriptional regulator [Pseudoxanthobacter soli]SHO67075.1 DNA-binding transcriptional regulator, MarR family [Pseudoxanthobacter soli DSM 19599]